MRELDSGDGAVLFDERRDFAERIGVRLGPDAAVPRCDAAGGGDAARLDHHQSGATDGAAAEVNEVPVGRHPITAGVLAHR